MRDADVSGLLFFVIGLGWGIIVGILYAMWTHDHVRRRDRMKP